MDLEKIEDMIQERNITLIKDHIPVEKMKGLYFDNVIIYDKSLSSSAEKLCILAEELGHYETSAGDILDYNHPISAKQERKARLWAAEHLIPFDDIIAASREGINNRYELAEFLNVTEEFLEETIRFWRIRYGTHFEHNGYLIIFEPLGVWTKEDLRKKAATDQLL